ESRSQSKSPRGTPARVKSESRSGSCSPSRVSKHSESHSRSRSKSRLWKGQMEWSWTVEEFEWIILLSRERTHLHLASTWADQLIVAVVEVEEVTGIEILTMIEDMIVDMTDMKTMITGTEEDHLLLT
ncbi:unnamed protein product, partial [Gulo gulo]